MSPQRALGNILVRHGAVPPEALEPLYAQQREKGAGSSSSCSSRS